MAEREPQSQRTLFPGRLALPRFQFSLWWLMVLVTATGVFLGVAAVIGDAIVWLLFVSIVLCVLPTPLVIGAIFARGDLRAFAIGALVPWIQTWLNLPSMASADWIPARVIGNTIYLLAVGMLCGTTAVIARRWIESREI